MNLPQFLAMVSFSGSVIGVAVGLAMVSIRIAGLRALNEAGINGQAHHVALSDLRSDAIMVAVFCCLLVSAVGLLPTVFTQEIDGARTVRIGMTALAVTLLHLREVFQYLDFQKLMKMIRLHGEVQG